MEEEGWRRLLLSWKGKDGGGFAVDGRGRTAGDVSVDGVLLTAAKSDQRGFSAVLNRI